MALRGVLDLSGICFSGIRHRLVRYGGVEAHEGESRERNSLAKFSVVIGGPRVGALRFYGGRCGFFDLFILVGLIGPPITQANLACEIIGLPFRRKFQGLVKWVTTKVVAQLVEDGIRETVACDFRVVGVPPCIWMFQSLSV